MHDTCTVNICFVRSDASELYTGGVCRATEASAGLDLRACLDADSIVIEPGERCLVPSGIAVQPCVSGMAGFVYSRSGLGAKKGLTVAQGVGVIDADYTGEILVFLLNTAKEAHVLRRGERMAQLIFQPVLYPKIHMVESLAATERGSGGFGHTGRL